MLKKDGTINNEEYTILVVDDQPEVIKSVLPNLKEEGYKVVSTTNGEDAINIVRNEQIDILLLDYFMPGLTGEQVVKEIRKFNKEIIILLQTGYTGEKPPMEMLELLDIQGYHDKTEGSDKLLLWVTACARTAELIRENKRAFEEVALAHQTIKSLKEDQSRLIEQERLASLGELFGSVTGKMSDYTLSLGNLTSLIEKLVNKYEESIDNENVTKQDQHEIAKKMRQYVKSSIEYSEILRKLLRAVQQQCIKPISKTTENVFLLKEAVNYVDSIVKEELVVNNCKLTKKFEADMGAKIKGNSSDLIHVIVNLIKNAMESYDKNGGQIDFRVSQDENNIDLSVKDYGKGIPKEVQEKIFKSMVSTRGEEATGLGLYISNSIVKGRFSGKMWFESEEGKGSAFYISIPLV